MLTIAYINHFYDIFMVPSGQLFIRSLSRAQKIKRKCDGVISIEDPQIKAGRKLRFHRAPHPPHLILRFEDIDHEDPNLIVAKPLHIEEALRFARGFIDKMLLIHCHAGISRSTAMAYAILCDRMGPGKEAEALDSVFKLRNLACPNFLVTKVADEILKRDGVMLSQLAARFEQSSHLRYYMNLKRHYSSRSLQD